MKIDMGLLCSVIMQQKMASCLEESKKELMALLKGEALLKAKHYIFKASLGTEIV